MFEFLSRDKPVSLGKGARKEISIAVIRFLAARGVSNFKVYTIDYEHHPVVLIQAEPQKKLRFSNILEIQIKQYLRDRLGVHVPAVFWRFKTDASEQPGPEQADYDYEDSPETISPVEALKTAIAGEENPLTLANSYNTRQLARNGMEVEEISMGEFDEFLKGTGSGGETPET